MRRAASTTTDDETTSPTTNPHLVCAADHPSQPVEWLWPDKIPLGKVTLLIGDPGTGKTLLALDVAARLSRAAPWPNSSDETRMTNDPNPAHSSFDIHHSSLSSGTPPSPLRLPPSSTLILSASDDISDTIRPRLDAAGADPRRIFILPSVADLRNDFAQLRAAVDATPDCRLIIIDPINAYVGPNDCHFHSVVRRVLAPLTTLAAERRIAVLAVAHLRKNDGPAIQRAAGSMGFVTAARSVWTVCRDPQTPGRQLFIPLKNNLTSTTCGLAYSIQSNEAGTAPRIIWDPTATDKTADSIDIAKKRGPQAIELADASKWLRNELAGGPRSSDELSRRAHQFGFHERTLRRALHAIGGDTQFRDIIDGWWWSLPTAEGGGGKAEARPHQPTNDNQTTYELGPANDSISPPIIRPSPFPIPDSTLPTPPSSDLPPSPFPIPDSTLPTPPSSDLPPSPFPVPDSALPTPPSPVPHPPSEKPVLSPKTCPLPRNTIDVPTPDPPVPPPVLTESIAYLNRVTRDRRRRDRPARPNRIKGRGQSPANRKRKRKQCPTETGNPVLDRMLDDLRAKLNIHQRAKSNRIETRASPT